jgi:hypothetical protein
MFGLEILDVVIGLTFVYLLLALLATAINEYISAVMNLRGKELARGLGRLLDDFDERDALTRAFNGVGPKLTAASDSLTERFYNHRLIRPLATRRGGLFQPLNNEPRLPSYIPARTFAMALLDVLGIDTKEANLRAALPGAGTDPAAPAPVSAADVEAAEKAAKEADAAAKAARTAADAASGNTALVSAAADAEQAAATAAAAVGRARLVKVLQILKLESPFDVKEHLQNLDSLLAQPAVPAEVRTQIVTALTGTQTQLQQLHDSVEVWFNNSMDRVSGAYKRTVQGWLFLIGLFIASCSNADTIDMWRRLSENDKVRDGMAARAIASVGVLDSVVRPRTRAETVPQPGNANSTALTQGVNGPTTGSSNNPPANPAATPATGSASGGTSGGQEKGGSPATEGALNAPPKPDSAKPLTPLDSAQLNYQRARARLDSMELKLGWTRENLIAIGFLDTLKARRQTQALFNAAKKKADSVAAARASQQARPLVPAWSKEDSAAVAKASSGKWWYGLNTASTRPGPFFSKLLGLFLTAIAISLGAPFWFDLLNKVISIRAAGRAPHEKPKSPEGPPKRAAEHTPM